MASSNCAVYCEAIVDFVDIDPKTYNMSVDALEQKLQEAELNGTLPKVVIPVHLAGQSCDMKSIHSLSLKYGFKIIGMLPMQPAEDMMGNLWVVVSIAISLFLVFIQ